MLDLRYLETNYQHGKEEKMIYLKKTRRDPVGLLLLTPDSLEMLQIQNGESGQKGGRKGKGDRTRKMKVCGRSTRMNDEHRGKNEP